jgi:tRNA A37 N6-isopentenylltransferase MiaA
MERNLLLRNIGRIFTMSTTSLIILIGVILIAAMAAWGFLLQRRSTRLRSRFGPEYDSAIHEYGDRSRAERALEVMKLRGYPMADFDRRAEDLSVDHPGVVRTYRAAHAIALTEQEGRATTEDLRQAMVYYRELFDELLETHPAAMPEIRR